MDTVVESSDQACLSAVFWSLEWVAVIRNIGHVFGKFAIRAAMICKFFLLAFKFIMFASCLFTN
jgi:hypothetical protein